MRCAKEAVMGSNTATTTSLATKAPSLAPNTSWHRRSSSCNTLSTFNDDDDDDDDDDDKNKYKH
jgi:hypothetical protein